MRSIVLHTAAAFALTEDDLTGRGRARHIAEARQAAAYVLRQRTTLSLVEIGKLLGGRDHTTMLHAVGAAEQRAVIDIDYALALSELMQGRFQ